MANFKIVSGTKSARMRRNPSHPFSVRFRPWVLTPCLIAPVLPGETMDRATIQIRAATDPLANKLTGWWMEFWMFYVKHRDMSGSADYQAMMLDIEKDMSAYKNVGTSRKEYVYDGSMKWVDECRSAVVDEYFRDEGTDHDDFKDNAEPIVKVNDSSWLDSVSNVTAYDVDEPEVTVGVDDKFTASEIENMMRQWEMLRGMGLQDMSYEDYLAMHGVRQTTEERNVPELLRHERSWSYPSNTVRPEDGSVASAVTWSSSFQATKPRFFKEPGFIFGCMTCRPKVYRRNQVGAACGMMDNALAWLPSMMSMDRGASLKEFATGEGPLDTVTDSYIADVKDILLYGDQYTNHTLAETTNNMVDLPTVGLNKEYPDSGDMDEVFDNAVSANKIYVDGICSFSIKGRQADTSASVASVA